ncbi:hypothetical protein C1H46_028493 [Malus baccata]|uniref:BTB domain-containing protein n=1 Tax=Malus baccata TaxID=106549 RepID=A0A540LHJ8_MALBA|nr:hypothetical protein C1H46_028493 [Malus baccata]
MERSQARTVTTRRGLKRKLEEDFRNERIEGEPDRKVPAVVEPQDDRPDLIARVREQVRILESKFSSAQPDRLLAKQAAHGLALTAKEEELVDIVVDCGAVPALVKHLQAPPPATDGRKSPIPYEHEVEKYCAYALGFIAIKVLNHLLYMMRVADKATRRRVALALAHLCNPSDSESIFISNKGLELLLGLLKSLQYKEKHDGSLALYKLATKVTSLARMDAAPPSPSPQVYLGEQYVNNPTLSDITFLVEGKRFYAHRICLCASSDAFRAMFDGGYRERDAKDIVIPNIRWEAFELMMRFIYTGSVDVTLYIAQDLLRAADQYLLEGLKRLCEHAIAQDICVENLSLMFELSEAFNAMSLQQACILFLLEQFEELVEKPCDGGPVPKKSKLIARRNNPKQALYCDPHEATKVQDNSQPTITRGVRGATFTTIPKVEMPQGRVGSSNPMTGVSPHPPTITEGAKGAKFTTIPRVEMPQSRFGSSSPTTRWPPHPPTISKQTVAPWKPPSKSFVHKNQNLW